MVGRMPRIRRDWVVAAALAGATFGTFASALRCQFVNYDDPSYVGHPMVLGGLTRGGARWAWTSHAMGNWHPLTWLSLQLDASLWMKSDGRLDPRGFHLTNVALHAANAALLFLALRTLTSAAWRSAAVALLFAVHPLRVESVAWVSERKDALSVCFGLLALWAYASYARRSSAGCYAAAVSAFLCSLTAKPMLATLPFLLLVLDWWPLGRWPARGLRRLVVEKLPLFALAAGSSVVTFYAQDADSAVGDLTTYPPAVRAGNAAVSYVAYLAQSVWPVGMAAYYPHPGGGLSPGAAVASAACLAVVTGVAVGTRRRAPYLLAGWLWYLGTLVPVIGLVQVGSQARADRYTYFPQVGVLLAACWGAADLARGRPLVAFAAAAAAAAALAAVTRAQVPVWHDSVTLWQNDVRVTGGNRLACYDLGSALAERNDYPGAADCYRRAFAYANVLPLNPSQPQLHLSLGDALQKAGRLAEATEQFEALCRAAPRSAPAHVYLGKVLLEQGELGGAAAHLEEAARLAPGQADVYCCLGHIAVGRNDPAGATTWFEQALRVEPGCAPAHCGLGLVLLRQQHLDEALAHMDEAVRCDRTSAEAHLFRGKVLAARGDADGAALSFANAEDLDRDSAAIRAELEGALRALVAAGKAERAAQIRARPRALVGRQTGGAAAFVPPRFTP
jgi:tetratricopeptide (TPR) repeat protein